MGRLLCLKPIDFHFKESRMHSVIHKLKKGLLATLGKRGRKSESENDQGEYE